MENLSKKERVVVVLYSVSAILALFAAWYGFSWIFRVSDQIFEMSLAGAFFAYQAFWAGCIAFLFFASAVALQTADVKRNKRIHFGDDIDKRYYNPK